MEDILNQARKVAEEVEVFLISEEETPVQFETNRLKHIQSKQSSSLALRIIKKGKIGYAITTRLSDGQDLINNAIETAQFGTTARFEFTSQTSFPEVAAFDPEVESIPLEKMVTLGEEMITAIRNNSSEIICEAGVTKRVVSVSMINSRGGEASYRKSIFSLGLEGNIIHGTDMLFVGEVESSCHPILETGSVVRAVRQQLDFASRLASVATGPLPVVFTPNGVAGALILPLMAAFNGKTVLEGASPIGSKIGQPVFDTSLWLWDDPTIPYRPGSRPCDDEGVPSQRTPLIQEGKVTSFLYDLQTAAQAQTRSTGNGSRARGALPAPSPSAFVIRPGQAGFQDMVRDMKEGLVIEQLLGAEQGNILSGDFSGNVLLGYKVENGEIVGRVKNTMVSGNVYQLLKQVTAIGSDARWVGGFLSAPSLYFPGISVASK